MEDQERSPISRRRLVLAAFVLGRKLAAGTARGEPVGVLLPNVTGAAVTIFALLAHGRVPAMLNFSAGIKNLDAAREAAGLKTIVTARRFVGTAKLEETVAALGARARILYLEDVRAGLGLADKLVGAAMARLPRLAYRRNAAKPDDTAVILFTSGTEGVPKGVALTHANLLANVAQILKVFRFTPDDLLFNALPVFHAFGLTGGLLLPLIAGFRVFLYPSPLHYKHIPELIGETKASFVVSTDTFAAAWARNAGPDDFRSVRLMVLGAERVKEPNRRTWRERFGIELLEGYGVTETAPVLAVNTPEHNRPGSVGRLLPGIEARLEPVPGLTGAQRLHVRGPNVMPGYYRAGGGIAPVAEGGWHDTGDIVSIDADGFVTISGRAKRFAKIGGEMVSLAAAETLAAAVWPDSAHAVVAVPDPKKGEALVLVTDAAGAAADALGAEARRSGFPEIGVPRKVVVVPELPMLGIGKLDYQAVQRIAGEGRG